MSELSKGRPEKGVPKRLHTVLILAGALLLVLSAANIILALNGCENESENIISGGDVVSATQLKPEPLTSWSGWQQGVVTASGAELISGSDGSVVCSLDYGTQVVVMQRRENLVYCRVGFEFGWLSVDELELFGEPQPVEDSSVSAAEPLELDGEHKAALDAIFEDYSCTGAGIAVIRDGELSHVYSYGWCDPYERTECNSDTKFRVASVSKVFVAASAAVLSEQGVVDIDEDISTYIGTEVANPYYPDDEITLRRLLTHTSSLTAFSVTGSGNEQLKSWIETKTIWRRITPGSEGSWMYSNGGIGIAAATLELASGYTLFDYTNRYFFEPLDADASFIANFIEDKNNIAPCYKGDKVAQTVATMLNKKYSDTPGDNYSFYAGGLVISAKDLAKFTCILINDGYYNGVYYMSPESVKLLESEQLVLESFTQCLTLRYCEDMLSGRDLYYHTGSSTGVVSLMSYDPETGDGVVVIANGSHRRDQYANGMSYLCEEAARYCYSELCGAYA